MPTVSIGMPVFNGEKYVAEAIESILAQTFTDFELIISDNSSTDSTAQICENYAKIDQRVVLYRNEMNLGAAKNYNLLPNYANGKYFKWAACDDMLSPTYLEKCHQILENERDVVICFPKTIFVDKDGLKIIKKDDNLHLQSSRPHQRLKKLILNYSLCMPITGLMRLESLLQTQLIGPFIGSDYILMIEMSLLGKFYQISEHLFFRRDHDHNVRRLPLKERAKWFNPHYKGLLYRAPTLLLLTEQIKSIHRINVPLNEKIKSYPAICIWIVKKCRDMLGKRKRILWHRFFGTSHSCNT